MLEGKDKGRGKIVSSHGLQKQKQKQKKLQMWEFLPRGRDHQGDSEIRGVHS